MTHVKNASAQGMAQLRWQGRSKAQRRLETQAARDGRARQRIALPSLPPAPAPMPVDVPPTADALTATDSLTTAERAARARAGIMDDDA